MDVISSMSRWVIDRLANAGDWLPLALSLIATIISILAYRRGAPPIAPRAWATFNARGAKGFSVIVNIENHTDGTIRLNSVRSPNRKLGINGRQLPADKKDWELPTGYEYDWVDEMPLSSELAPGQSFSRNVVFASVDSRESIKLSLILSISTMRRTIKTRAIVIPIMIPAIT